MTPVDRKDVAAGALAGALAGFLLRDLGLLSAASAWVPASLAGALVGASRWLRAWLGAVSIVTLFWLAVAFTPRPRLLCRGLTRYDLVPKSADAAIVLGSRLQADGEATTTAESRLLRALELFAQGLAAPLVVTEAPPPAASHARLAREMAGRLGVRIDVLAVGPVRTTHEEAVAVAALCRARGFRHVILVTSPLQSLRGALALEHEGLVVSSAPAKETAYDLERLDRPTERLLAFADATHEWLGLLYYRTRNWVVPPR